MIRLHDIVRLSAHLFPNGDATEEQWNNRRCVVTSLILPEVIKDNSVWRVEPLFGHDEDDYLHVHTYEMSPTAFAKETDENV